MKFDKVVKGGTIVNGDCSFCADVGIEAGKIAAIGASLDGAETINASGMLVLPGAIDPHVHLQLPFGGTISSDDFENGTKAAACGGVTTVIDFAMQQPGSSLVDAVEKRRSEADGRVCVDYSLHASITRFGQDGRKQLEDALGYGVSSFKMFMIYRDEGWMSDDAALFQALEASAELGARIGVHAESANLLDLLRTRMAADPRVAQLGARAHALTRPPVTEWEAVQRALAFAEHVNGRLYVVHTSTARAARMIGAARERGVDAICETCPQYLLLDDSVFGRPDGHLYATCPQIKSAEDAAGLWECVEDGRVQVIATDTCTFTKAQKDRWNGDFRKIPFGLPGVENLVPLTYTAAVAERGMAPEKWVRLVSENPARIFGLYPQKGTIRPGSDADVVVFDPARRSRLESGSLQTNCDWSPYEGFELKGVPVLTLSRGVEVAREGKFTGKTGHGRFLKRSVGGLA